jgi:ABC-2 type transport system ATP-binding protein
MAAVIETRNLTKHYGKVHAVEDVSICIYKGEIYGFLGLNGAGKTTTIRMLLGMIRPTAGESYIKGEKIDAGRQKLWNSVGYLVEIPYSYPGLTVRENLEIFRRLRCIDDPSSVDIVIKKLKLGLYKNRLAKHLSLGNAQRLGLAKALLHNPEILILDEPANGLDPAGIVEIRQMLLDLAKNQGVTIFISSHILDEISRFATRIGIIHEGTLIRETDFSQLDRLRQRTLHIGTRNNDSARLVLEKHGYRVSLRKEGLLEVAGKDPVCSPEKINLLLVHEGNPPVMLKVEEEDLESYFLRVIKEKGGMA